jgi:2'-hydroxyisoflavone reductase
VEAARARGDEITLFHRGRTGPDLFPEVEHVLGDRDTDLDRLAGRTFDAVVDTCGYYPRQVREAVRVLAGRIGHYTFVSSISVYEDFPPGLDVDHRLNRLEDPGVEEVTPETYGGLKVLCEEEAVRGFGDGVLNVRAGLLVGPHDYSGRLPWWIRRVSLGGRIPVPEPADRPLQIVHSRDLCDWILRMAVDGRGGTFHGTGPECPHTLTGILQTIVEASGSQPDFVWMSESFLNEHEIGWWSEFPLCMPTERAGVMQVDVRRTLDAGMRYRPLSATVREVLAWDMARPPGTLLEAGLLPEREAELLAAWEAARA